MPPRSQGILVLALATVLILTTRDGHCGANAAGGASLTWDIAGQVHDLTAVPTGPLPLYLHLYRTSRIKTIAATLTWYPQTGTNCYRLVSHPPTDSMGYAVAVPPEGGFEGDESFTWSIVLPPNPPPDVAIAYLVDPDSCGSITPGSFLVRSLQIEDLDGHIDELHVPAPATILGGEETPVRVMAQALGTESFQTATTSEVHVVGQNLGAVRGARLNVDGLSIEASQVDVESPQYATVTFSIPSGIDGRGQLTLTDELGSVVDTLAHAVLIADTTAATGTGLNGRDWALTKAGAGGDWWKQPGSAAWEFRPEIPDSLLQHWNTLPPQHFDDQYRAFAASNGRAMQKPSLQTARSRDGFNITAPIYKDTLLFKSDFEPPSYMNNWTSTYATDTTTAGKWGLVESSCGQHHGQASMHCSQQCSGYPALVNTLLRMTTDVDVFNYAHVTAACSVWVDTRPFDDPAYEGVFAYYSKNNGFSWIVINPGNANAWQGPIQAWQRKVLLDFTQNPDSSVGYLRFLYRFVSQNITSGSHAGVYIDDVSIKAMPRPNLTYLPPLIVAPSMNASASAPVTAGQTAYLTYTMRNNSASASDSFNVVFGAADGSVYVVDDGITTLGGDATTTRHNVPFTVPTFMCGAVPMVLAIDAYNAINEANESPVDNNESTIMDVVTEPRANLVVSYVSYSSTPSCVGENSLITVEVRNAGSAASASSHVGIYPGLSNPPGVGLTPAASQPVGALAVGGTATVQFSVTRSTAGFTGYYFLADCFGSVNESGCNEGDNSRGPYSLQWIIPGADLLATELYGPSSGHVGTPATIRLKVHNGGTQSASRYIVNWYQNLGHAPTAGDPADRSYFVKPALLAGHDTTIVFTATTTTSGTWQMYAKVDAYNDIQECASGEANNLMGPVALSWQGDSLTIVGRIAYRDTCYNSSNCGGAIHGVPFAKVAIYDYDYSSAADSLGRGCTDANGFFAVSIPAVDIDEPLDGALPDPYVIVRLDSDATCGGDKFATCRGWVDSTIWRHTSSNHWDAVGVDSLGTIMPVDYATRSAMHVYTTVVNTAIWSKQQGVTVDGSWHCDVIWLPGSAGELGTTQFAVSVEDTMPTLFINGDATTKADTTITDYTPDEWDNHPIQHEYGHFVAYLCKAGPTLNECPPHSLTAPCECPAGQRSMGLAWEEGWASFFGAAASPGGPMEAVVDYGAKKSGTQWTDKFSRVLNLETGEVIRKGVSRGTAWNDSVDFEVANAGVLWDIIDGNQDNAHSDACGDSMIASLQTVLDVALGHDPNPKWHMGWFYHEMWSRYHISDPMLVDKVERVLCEHRMLATNGNFVAVDPEYSQSRATNLDVWPNPFAGHTTIHFNVGEPGMSRDASLAIYDVTGRRVRVLTHGPTLAGNRVLAWDGRSDAGARVLPGVYFCRLVAGTSSRQIRLVLVH